jgi:tetratricopeptide (TPR) repeat protein
VFAAIVDRGLTGTEDYYRVASGLIFAYYELGDLSHAMAWARQLIQETESAGSRKGQAALYWNAAIVAEGLGELNEAIHMAERALAQMSESTNTRDLVRLRIAMAQLLVLSDPPRAEEAWNTLALASDQLDDLGSEMDHMRWERTAAIALVLRGVLPKARELAEAAVSRATEGAEDQAVSLTTLGDVHLAEGDAVEGLERYRAAAELLHSAPPNRATARAWRDLGDRFTTLDHPDEAASCFAEALVIVGLPDRSAVLRSARSRTARPSKTLQG